MLSPEARLKRDSERQAIAAYWAGRQERPLTLEFNDAYCICDVFFPSIWARLKLAMTAAAMGMIGWIPFAAVKIFFYRWMGIKIGRNVYIAPGVVLDPMFPRLIEIEDNALLGFGCHLFTHEYTAAHFRVGRIHIGKGSVIGAYATIRSGVRIGNKVTVGFNSYVNENVPDGSMIGGVPAKPLKSKSEGA